MIRKNTWFVLAVFVVLLAAVLVLQRTRGSLTLIEAKTTPSATSTPLLLAGWQAQDLSYIEWRGDGQTLTLSQSADGSWVPGPMQSGPVDTGKIEMLRSSLFSLRPIAVLGTGNPVDGFGLSTPLNIILLRSASGQQTQITLGSSTPTGSGYYAQVDSNPPVIVEKYEVESMLEQLRPAYWATATPLPATLVAPATATP
jgi:hypothetical protein